MYGVGNVILNWVYMFGSPIFYPSIEPFEMLDYSQSGYMFPFVVVDSFVILFHFIQLKLI